MVKKFYEEQLHEKKLANKHGQFLRGSRYCDQDWYGNELVLHTERTYFGDDRAYLTSDQLTDNPKKIFDYTNVQITEFLERLQLLVPDGNIDINKMQTIIEKTYGHPDVYNHYKNVYVYEDDGNTRTEGFQYKIYWVIPLSERNPYLDSAILNDFAVDVIYFSMEFTERIHDSEINSRFFTLKFNGIENDNERIDMNNDNMTINSIITPMNLFKVGKKLVTFRQDETLLKKAYEVFEQ